MDKKSIEKYLDKKIQKLTSQGVGALYIIDDLNKRVDIFKNRLIRDEKETKMIKQYLINYILLASKWIEEIEDVTVIAKELGHTHPKSIYNIIKLKRKLSNRSTFE